MESIFATVFGYLFFNETLSPLALMGCFLVVLSVALIPLMTNYEKKEKS
jgi:drug/metabolite transporter (DMT)-like permease